MSGLAGRERLRRATDRAAAELGGLERRLAARRGEGPRPGDLYLLPATGERPVEWLVVATADGPGRALVVPADTRPLAGSGDVEVPAGRPGGPLSLRCRYGAWVRAELVAAGRRTGVVAPATVDAARRRLRAVEAGADLGSALAREVDEESAYRTWIEETVAPARDALVRLQLDRLPGGRVALLRRRPVRAAAALAALFVLAAVGLSLWVAALRREVERLSRPSIGVSFETISFGETTRGPAERPAVPNASFVVLYVTLGIDVPPYDRYRLELADAEATRLWISPPFAARPYAEIPVVVPGRLLPLAGDLRLRLYGVTAAEPRLIEERVVAVRPPGP